MYAGCAGVARGDHVRSVTRARFRRGGDPAGFAHRGWRVLAQLPVQLVLVSVEALDQLIARAPTRGVFRTVSFDAGGDDARAAGRRADGSAGSITPNTIGIGIDPSTGCCSFISSVARRVARSSTRWSWDERLGRHRCRDRRGDAAVSGHQRARFVDHRAYAAWALHGTRISWPKVTPGHVATIDIVTGLPAVGGESAPPPWGSSGGRARSASASGRRPRAGRTTCPARAAVRPYRRLHRVVDGGREPARHRMPAHPQVPELIRLQLARHGARTTGRPPLSLRAPPRYRADAADHHVGDQHEDSGQPTARKAMPQIAARLPMRIR